MERLMSPLCEWAPAMGFSGEAVASGRALVIENCETARLFLEKTKCGDDAVALELQFKVDDKLGAGVKKRDWLHAGMAEVRGCEEKAIVVAVVELEMGSVLGKTVGDSEKLSWSVCSSCGVWPCRHLSLTAEETAAICPILF